MQAAKRASRRDDPATGLAAVAELRREVDVLEVEQVRQALATGWSWQRIAKALGVSKQAAHRKHAPRFPRAAGSSEEQRQRLVITGQARRAVEHAREEAQGLGHPAVEPQHLLLGLIRQQSAASVALRRVRVALDAARREVRELYAVDAPTDPELPRRGRVPVSPDARACFEQSLREAVGRGDAHLGPEHLLLALLGDREGGAMPVLARLGVPTGRLSSALERAVAEVAPPPEDPAVPAQRSGAAERGGNSHGGER